MKCIGVLSDTHIKDGGRRQLPARLFDDFAGVDLILHAGDLLSLNVITDLETIAPVLAVHGNNESYEAMSRLESTQLVTVEGCGIGVVHGHLPAAATPPPLPYAGNTQTAANALSHFPDVECVVFGHSHWPLLTWHEAGERRVLLLNPGSATDRRRAPRLSCALLRVDGERLLPELIEW